MARKLSLRNYRSSLLFAAGVLITGGAAVSVDGAGALFSQSNRAQVSYDQVRRPVSPRALTAQDQAAAEIAWRYFDQNFRPETGFVDSVAGYPSGTLWDQGSYLMALMSAHALGVIEDSRFAMRADALLSGMERLPLFDGLLPNKVYHSQTLDMVDYQNQPVPDGIGWSALDIARMLMALRVLERRSPEYGPRIATLLSGWTLEAMAHQGELFGAGLEQGKVLTRQEGRIGYEQYGARAAALWGLDVLDATTAARVLDWRDVSGVPVPTDLRRASAFRAITPTLSEPYFLQGLEMGLSGEAMVLADRVYSAQENRYRATGQLTMVSEDNVDQAPWFLYSSVFANGADWAVVTEKGETHPELRTISLKAAFAWDALYGTPYTAQVRGALQDLQTAGGWAAGRYESDGSANDVLTLNTNAVVLESIHYIAQGPLWQYRK